MEKETDIESINLESVVLVQCLTDRDVIRIELKLFTSKISHMFISLSSKKTFGIASCDVLVSLQIEEKGRRI